MVELKTRQTSVDVTAFLDAVDNPVRRDDGRTVCALMQRISGEEPRMWGPSIVGFGRYHYRYDSGHEGVAFLVGFAPRKAEFSIYLMGDGGPRRDDLLARLGKHRMGKACLYVKRLSDIDLGVLRELAALSVSTLRQKYPAEN